MLNSSCYTYKVFPKEYRKLENSTYKYNAYVVNDLIHKELKILESSDIFNITTDSSKADLRIKLYPLEEIDAVQGYTIFGWNTGEDLSFGLITLGQLPISFDYRYRFKFDEIKQDAIIKRNFELKITHRIWFWDAFNFNKRFEEKASKALLGSYINNK